MNIENVTHTSCVAETIKDKELDLYKLIMDTKDHPKAYITTIGWSNEKDSIFCIWIKYEYATYFATELQKIFGKKIFGHEMFTCEEVFGFNIKINNKKGKNIFINLTHLISNCVNLENVFPKEKYSLRRNIQNELFELITNYKNDHANYVNKFEWSENKELLIYVKYKHMKKFISKLRKIFGNKYFDDKPMYGNLKNNIVCINLSDTLSNYTDIDWCFDLIDTYHQNIKMGE